MATGLSRQRPSPLYTCPTEPNSLSFATHWYRFPNNDRFLICTKCYEEKVHHLPALANALRCDFLDFGPGSRATCDFNTPRIDALLRQGIATNNFQPLQSFAERRLDLLPCAGTAGVQGGSGTVWFTFVDNVSSPSYICCKACYEDMALGSAFASRFILHAEQQPTDATWSCDLAVPFLRQRLQACAPRGDWMGFVRDCHHRMTLPECQKGVFSAASAKRWFNTVSPFPVPDMSVCEACFLDRVGWQEGIVQRFAPMTFSPFELTSRFSCDFKYAPMVTCSDNLLAHGMFDRWHQAASMVMSKPSCSNEGVTDGEWYGLPDPMNPSQNVQNFEICAACQAGWNQSTDWAHLFRRFYYPPGTVKVCDLNASSSPRHAQYVAKWTEMYLTRNPTSFIKYVSRCAFLPTCEGTTRLANARWYGDADAALLICPSCFEEAVRDTPLAASFPLQNALLPGEHHCSLYSTRMREKYTGACKQQTLAPLLHFASHREGIYQQTIPQIEAFCARQGQQTELLKAAKKARAHSTQITAMGRAFMGGPPIVHNFDPSVVMHTLNVRNQQQKLASDPQRLQMLQLEALWKEVE